MARDSKQETEHQNMDSYEVEDETETSRDSHGNASAENVQVLPNLIDLTTSAVTSPEEIHAVKERRDLNEVVHRMLIIGLLISTALILVGLVLDIALKREVPTVVPDVYDVFVRVTALRPSGFLALGLLVLIATPIFRVIASIFVFIYERDWRFVVITFIVFLIVMISVVFGKG